jgi:hypothetical protein
MRKTNLLFLSIFAAVLSINARERKSVFEYSIKPLVSEFKSGSVASWAMGIGWEHNYSNHFAWDILELELGNTWKGFKAENTAITLQTGPKIYFSASNEVQPFFAFKASFGGIAVNKIQTVADGNGLFGVAPEIGVNFSRSSNLSIGYSYTYGSSSTTINGTRTERYKTGSHKVWLYSQNRYMWIDEYATRTVSTSETIKSDISSGAFYVRLGVYF